MIFEQKTHKKYVKNFYITLKKLNMKLTKSYVF